MIDPTTRCLTGHFIGVGVGPGDPELLTLKALRLIRQASVVCYLTNAQGHSQSRAIAAEAFRDANSQQLELAIPMPFATDRTLANKAYDAGAQAIRAQLDAGREVVFICEGDPLFFGSFAYLLERLQGRYACQVVPGISSVHAAAAALQRPLTRLKESMVVLSGRHDDAQIRQALLDHDTVVLMKGGRARPRILALLAETGRSADARYLEYIGRETEHIEADVTQLVAEPGPYFSLFVVTRSAQEHR
ncbi:MAG: precorrin-2/cobalt-factor-2 C20-methyltransferase [Motiliproteus sp.]|jgi:precorrin-2/cobalt-factor-2 C20-methyltransferase